nr:silent chromatin protein ESC1 isoform X2 [Bactrocera oleae]
MKLKIALIALLSVATSSALSLEGFKCRDHTVMTGDPVAPRRTVRICGVQDYDAPPSFLDFPKIFEIEQKARNNDATNSYNNNAFWPNRGYLRSPRPSYARWPLAPQQILAAAPATHGATTGYPTNSRHLMEAERLLQEKLRSITEDTSEIKSSVNEVVTNIKNMLDTLLIQNANQQKDINVNVNLKLEPSLEALLRDFMALIKNEVNSEDNKEPTSTERIEDSSDDNSEDNASFYSTAYTNEKSSEEQVTEAQVDSAEHSTEKDATEEYEGNSSVEDFDKWMREHFGPIVKTSTYDEDTDNSEQENSVERSEESFESWFNAVYRKQTTETPTDYSSLDQRTHNSAQSQENVQKESVENTQENNNQYLDVTFDSKFDDIIKSSEENTVSLETTESNEETGSYNYDYIFVPTTMHSLEPSEIVEEVVNGDRYNYATEMEEKIKMQQKFHCNQTAYFSNLNGSGLLRERLIKCLTAYKNTIIIDDPLFRHSDGDTKETEETDTVVIDSNESESSEETPSPIIVSNESKSSEETNKVVTESNESKSIEETEIRFDDSNESKSSEETPSPIIVSNESKSSEETNKVVTESRESKSIEETKIRFDDSNEMKSSEETYKAVTGLNESNHDESSEETETPFTDYPYDYDIIELLKNIDSRKLL